MGKFIDLTGQKFGKLTVIKRVENSKNNHARWLCKCDCGKFKTVLSTHLVRRNIESCGCIKQKNKYLYKLKYGDLKDYNRLYHIYNGMRSRCNNIKNVSYKNYGNRGIKVCNEWLNDFLKFVEWAMENGYRKDLTIDRIDSNKNYEPNNCRWITIKEQENNRRNNVFIKYKNKNKTLKQWSEELNIPYNTIYSRYVKKLKIEKILSKGDLRKNEKSNE